MNSSARPLVASRDLLLAALIPSITLSLMTAAVFLGVPWPMSLPLPLVANFALGKLIGRSAPRRPFLLATGVAIAGWLVGVFGVTAFYFALIAPHVDQSPAAQVGPGFGLFICGAFLLGLVTSPIAWIGAW